MYFITVLCTCNASFDVAGYNAILKKKIMYILIVIDILRLIMYSMLANKILNTLNICMFYVIHFIILRF